MSMITQVRDLHGLAERLQPRIGMLDGSSADEDIRSAECRESGCGLLPHFWGTMRQELRRIALREQYHLYYNQL